MAKRAGAHVEERRSFKNLWSAAGAPLQKILKAGAPAGEPLLKKLWSASQSAAPKYVENRGRSAHSENSPKFNSLVTRYEKMKSA